MATWVADRVSQNALIADTGGYTGWFLSCNHNWTSDEPVTWSAVRHGQTFPFPTKAEAMAFAEVTYELERNP